MQGDVILIQQEHRDAARLIVAHVEPQVAAMRDEAVLPRPVRFAPDQAPRNTPVFRRERLGLAWSTTGPVADRRPLLA